MTNINVKKLLDVKAEAYSAILEEVTNATTKITDRVEATFHFIRYYDCQDREFDFLKIWKYTIYYWFLKERYKHKYPDDITDLTYEARDKFFNPSNSNKSIQLGEFVLYFLWESYLKAPQIVSKMSLKTTGDKNFNGSDGIHFGIYHNKKCIFYCESKLDEDRGDAFRFCKESLLDFHKNKKDFEVSIIRNNIDIEDQNLRQAIIYFIDPIKEKRSLVRIACFVGYDWNKFLDIEKERENGRLHERLKAKLQAEIKAVKDYLKSRITYPEISQRFCFFVIPFKDVKNLRKKF